MRKNLMNEMKLLILRELLGVEYNLLILRGKNGMLGFWIMIISPCINQLNLKFQL